MESITAHYGAKSDESYSILCGSFYDEKGNLYLGFGSCPRCFENEQPLPSSKDWKYRNLGSDQWFYCESHKLKWCDGPRYSAGFEPRYAAA